MDDSLENRLANSLTTGALLLNVSDRLAPSIAALPNPFSPLQTPLATSDEIPAAVLITMACIDGKDSGLYRSSRGEEPVIQEPSSDDIWRFHS
jgi:hypothetical protein